MREIKFRGFDKENNCWRYGWYTRLPEGARKYDAIICDEDGPLVRYYIHHVETIEQYTGLKDKNGIEIYEGDIVEHLNGRQVVRYIDKTASFQMGLSDYVWDQEIGCYDDIIVIGNMHENPELLEGLNETNI